MSPSRTISALAGVLLGTALLTASSGASGHDDTAAGSGGSGVPAPGSAHTDWQAWADQEVAAARAFDWVADSAARGCELLEVDIATEVEPGYNASLGAPRDLETVRVDRVEECAEGAQERALAVSTAPAGGVAPASVPTGSQCNAATQGPGTICLSRSGSMITASWLNRGSSAVTGFVRIYTIPTSASHCPTGTTWQTSPELTWSPGQTRSTSKSQTAAGAYSAHIWRKALIGHTNWGGTCARF